MVKITAGSITSLIMVVVLAVVLFNVAAALVPQAAISANTLLTNFTDSNIYGTTGAAVGTAVSGVTGVFWIVGGLVAIITIALGMWKLRR